jgi:hypothetical protein
MLLRDDTDGVHADAMAVFHHIEQYVAIVFVRRLRAE